ncbi:hypothetical protein HYFRA_00014002 [Hymenoscyphus fraxineus]|uniref:Uncharacterized protein n=1 Tax=Hymenoscyphus fraxineus TaxID=746836 RepID=A0A9N9L7S5_9HELO|nr:hypothetical protein HYFRA_00014002 [Hymenoscyphus fraxineus]
MKFTISITLITLLATASAAVVDLEASGLLPRQACGGFRAYCGQGFVPCCSGRTCGRATSGSTSGWNECS